jgi:hypothetical protein
MIKRFGGAVAVVAMAAALMATPSEAKPLEQFRFNDQFSQVIDGYCGDLQVLSEFHDSGVLVGRTTGRDRTPRYTQSHHGGVTTTNLATGRATTITWDYTVQDVRVTNNGDGTISILTQIPGPERLYGPDGELVYTSGGTYRVLTVVDYGGTLSDPSDDTFVSETVVSSNGGRPQPDINYCEAFHTLTA